MEVGSDVKSLTSLNNVKYSPESGDLVLSSEEYQTPPIGRGIRINGNIRPQTHK